MLSVKERAGLDLAGRDRAGRVSVAAVAILLAAFGLRVWRLGSQSFWWDEAYSTMVARKGWGEIIATLAREDFHPPLHYFLLHVWLRLVGSSEFALRYSSVLAGVLAVAVAWAAARRFFGRSAALGAALIFAIAPFLWYYTRETRMFALIPLFTVLTLYCCARAVESGRWRWWAAYAVGAALGLYDLYYAIFLPFAAGAWVFLLYLTWGRAARRAVIGWAVATLAAFAAYLPWVPIFLARAQVWTSAFTPDNGPIKVVLWSWVSFVLGLPTLALYQDPRSLALLAGMALTLLASLAWALRSFQRTPVALLAAFAFIGPLLVMAAISAIKPVFHPRYAMPAAPGFYLLIAGLWGVIAPKWSSLSGSTLPWPDALAPEREPDAATRDLEPKGTSAGWIDLPSHLGRIAATIGLTALIGGSFILGLSQLNANPTYARDDYRGAIDYVATHEQAGDAIIHNATPPFAYYWQGGAPATYFPSRAYNAANVVAELNEVTAGRKRLWSVMNITIPNDPDRIVDAQLRLYAQKLDERWYGPLRVQLWQIPRDHAFAVADLRPLKVNLANQFILTGWSLAGDPVGGQSLDVGLTVQTQTRPAADNGFWVALVDARGGEWGRGDARPHDEAYRQTSAWEPGQSTALRLDLPVLIGTPPGEYQLVAGAYRLSDLAGLDVLDTSGHAIGQQAELGAVTIDRVVAGPGDPSLANQRKIALGGGLTLLADQIDASSVLPGDALPVTLLWTTTAPLAPTQITLRLQAANGGTVTQDESPIAGGLDPARWPIGGMIREQRRLVVPADAAPGQFTLLLDTSAGGRTDLGPVTIAGVKREFQPPTSANPLEASFEDILGLVGYGLSSTTVHPGDTLTVTLDWQAIHPTATSYRVFVHALDASNNVLAQWDGVPRDWAYPTSAWLPGEFVRDQYPLRLPVEIPPGAVTLEVGWYDATSGKRLTVERAGGASEDRVILQTVRVEPR